MTPKSVAQVREHRIHSQSDAAHGSDRSRQASGLFLGIDWAEDRKNWRACELEVSANVATGRILETSPESIEPYSYERLAVDSPLGTTALFEAILAGHIPEELEGFSPKYRRTEQILQDVLEGFSTVKYWREDESKVRRKALNIGTHAYFNRGSHIKPSVGLSMVPEVICWCQEKSKQLEPATGVMDRLASIRMGTAAIVEAHPRLFLHSVLETLPRETRQDLKLLESARDYKVGEKEDGQKLVRRRCELYGSIGRALRELADLQLAAEDVTAGIFESGHNFDAWLCSLTAWAHASNLTWTAGQLVASGWEKRAVLEREGHILILFASLPKSFQGARLIP